MTALDDHSISCSEKIVNLHEATLEQIEKELEERGMAVWNNRANNVYSVCDD